MDATTGPFVLKPKSEIFQRERKEFWKLFAVRWPFAPMLALVIWLVPLFVDAFRGVEPPERLGLLAWLMAFSVPAVFILTVLFKLGINARVARWARRGQVPFELMYEAVSIYGFDKGLPGMARDALEAKVRYARGRLIGHMETYYD